MGTERDRVCQVGLNDTVDISGARMVISLTSYYTDAWLEEIIRVQKNPLAAVVGYYRGNPGICQEEDDSSVLTLPLKDSSPICVEDVSNMLITVYDEEAIRDRNQAAVNTADFISERPIIIGCELGGVEMELGTFKYDSQIMDVSSTASSYTSESQQLNNQVLELEAQPRLARYIKDYLEDHTKGTDLISSSTGIDNASIENQISQYNTIKLHRDKLIDDSSDGNPVVEELNNLLHVMKQSIIRAADNMVVSINVRRNDTRGRGMRTQSRVSSIPTKEKGILSIERQQKIKEVLYLFLLNRQEESALSQAMVGNNARMIDGAGGSTVPITPLGKHILLLGVLMGFALPCIVFLVRISMDTYVHSRKDLKGKVSVPFLGEVPLDKETTKSGRKRASIDEKEDDAVSEVFRILWTNMPFMEKKDNRIRIITFTSFNESVGKTFILRNLGMNLVYVKKRVLLLDMDIRKGTLSRHFHKHKLGLINYLANSSIRIDGIIHHDGNQPGLDIISPETVIPNPAESLMNERLDGLVKELCTRYDYIVADSVPVSIIADATITNHIVDLTIFTVRAEKLDRRQLPDTGSLYQEKTLNNMALVLNSVDVSHRRYGYGYGYRNYGYGKYERKK